MNEQLPADFLARVREQLREEYPDWLDAMAGDWYRGIRLNRLKSADVVWPDLIERVPWAEDGWYLNQTSRIGVHPLHEGGGCYLQEPSAMLPAAVLAAKPGEKVLDLCAAPGGKSTQIAADLSGEGLLVSNEPVLKRAMILSRNIERMGIPNSVVTSAWPADLAKRWPGFFDAVMVDAPCSGEGMFRRHPESREEWSPEMAAGCAERQLEILEHAAKLVRPGGRMVYATCTMNPMENENNVVRFLEVHPEFHLEPFTLPGADSSQGMLTVWLHRMKGEGQFAALLRKREDVRKTDIPMEKFTALDRNQRKALASFCDAYPGEAVLWGDIIVTLPQVPTQKGIKVLRNGLHLGRPRGNVFQPDHAWALCFHKPPFPTVELTEEEAFTWLTGETLPKEGKGWVLPAYRNLVLGWGKISDGVMKNHYPKGLRRP